MSHLVPHVATWETSDSPGWTTSNNYNSCQGSNNAHSIIGAGEGRDLPSSCLIQRLTGHVVIIEGKVNKEKRRRSSTGRRESRWHLKTRSDMLQMSIGGDGHDRNDEAEAYNDSENGSNDDDDHKASLAVTRVYNRQETARAFHMPANKGISAQIYSLIPWRLMILLWAVVGGIGCEEKHWGRGQRRDRGRGGAVTSEEVSARPHP